MPMRAKENRRYRRIYFDPADWMMATFEPLKLGEPPFHGQLMNISINGLAFQLGGNIQLHVGDVLTLTHLEGRLPITFSGRLQLQVKWVMANSFFEHPAIGCEFINPPCEFTDRLGNFIYNEVK